MEVSTEAAVDVFSLPSNIESQESKSLIVADGFSSKSQVEALNDELMEDSHEDPVNSPNSLKTLTELSCGEQCLVSISSKSGNQISVPSQSNQDGSGSFLANGNEDGELDSGHRLVASCDSDDSEPDSPMQLAREKLTSSSSDSKLADGNVEDEEEGSGNDDEKENPRRLFHYDPYSHAMYHNQWGHFDPEFHEYHPGLPPPWIRRFRRQPCPQLWNRWDDREKRRNQEYRLPGFMQETGPTGVGAALFNKGNTCYINAILQCFTHTVPLVQALRSWNHETPCITEGFCVLCVLRDHIELSLSSSGKILEPLKLVNNLENISSVFRRYQQEDAHEFFQCLLERLERHCLDSSLTDDSASSHDKNIVERVFGGRLVSKLRCCNCGHCSDKYEPLIDLSLEIEDANSLQSALESFTKVEKIEDSGTKFTCESCKKEVSREKQLMLDQAPSVAALHLKRFKIDGTSIEKIGKHVQFPLELDLKPYTNDNEDSDEVGFKYQLYAVVVHKGDSLMSGHYFCYIRSSPDTWHKLDDPEVSKEQEEFVLSQAAYILFYAREGTPWCSSLIKPQELCSDPNNSNTSPKSVLDNVNRECTGVGDNKSSETNVIKDAIEATSTHIPFERNFEESESRVETRGNFAQISPAKRPNFHRILSIGETPMVDVSVPFGASDYHDGVLHDEMLCFPPSVEEDNCNQGAEKIEINGDLHSPTPHRSPTPDKGLPEARHRILRDHQKGENRVNCKRSSKKVAKDSQTAEALRCIKRMPTARGMKLMAALLPRNDKTRPRSSPCKRASPPGSRCKPTIRMAVMR
ncbi:PREDICTED: ubiquitin carboxyl-terminal hydrolase 21-like isoform X2 [Populus euphratica]|uniref:ubiquitinyl hydrolase 1 n=1 Tax=Populus euphratica TaxID=75702 RepID=A0AAJ6XH83_POPEU|nr:PREDICTED: ubiquitin carboxyl-terminal hydrolase 21-like isoform X2 [Populus euphratica]